MYRVLSSALLLLATPAAAADRVFSVGSYERVRVDGPFEVRIVTGGSPGAKASGDRQLVERLAIAVNGTVLSVRLGAEGWGEMPRRRSEVPTIVTLTTPRLTSLAVSAGARVAVTRMASQRIELSVIGSGTVALDKADADELRASLTGAGSVTIGGRANRATLLGDGAGTIDASAMTVNDLIVHLSGAGETKAAARYTAQVTSTGLGRVTVTGNAKCVVKALAGGPVSCGAAR
jgi:hypothetical protein